MGATTLVVYCFTAWNTRYYQRLQLNYRRHLFRQLDSIDLSSSEGEKVARDLFDEFDGAPQRANSK